MNALLRRRGMIGRVKTEDIDIPIGVNLYTPQKYSYYYDQRSNNIGTKNYGGRSGGYTQSDSMPFDSRCEFYASGFTATGNTTGYALDADGYIRGIIEATNGSDIKSACVSIEQSEGYKITAVLLTANGGENNTAVWMRIE